MKRLSLFCLLFIVLFSSVFYSQISTRKGWWKFDDTSNLLKAEQNYGKDLELKGTHQTVAGPAAGNDAVKIGVGSYYKMSHGMAPNGGGGGTFVNEYTLQIDFSVPAIDGWRCFFQTNPANSTDGDCFINAAGNIGTAATGYSAYAVKANEWYRLIVSVKNGVQFNTYLDGQLLRNGTIQSLDGRFSLDTLLLIFADEDGEDKEINCAELAIWDHALTAGEIASLGGYGHKVLAPGTSQLILVPFLNEPTTNSVYVSWHDTISTITQVEYGTTPTLGQTTDGTSEIIGVPYRWHSVKLSGLQPYTEYFYKAVSGSGSSEVYSFRTLPDSSSQGKIRFLLLSDTHSTDTTMAVKIIKEAKKKIQQLYGSDIQNHLNFVLHSGDLVVDGNNIIQWTDEFFAPISPISPSIPFMTVTGNHEAESQNYYKYMHYDEVSPVPAASEKFWSFRAANTLFIGLNSNAITTIGTLQKTLVEQMLMKAEADTSIDFVFVISHHMVVTELWGEGITFDGGPNYMKSQIYPLLKKYSKVVQHSYGHTHGFERGTVESEAVNPRGDFRMVCGGGGGGATDRWGAFRNSDFPEIQITYDDYFYQIIEIDPSKQTFESSMYSLGNASKSRDSEVRDHWYRKVNQPAPANPVTFAPTVDTNKVTFNTSQISGDSLMTVKIQVADNEAFSSAKIDTMVHWTDIYGAPDANFTPKDVNIGIDLTKLSFEAERFGTGKQYYYRVKYRDHNLKWSGWSNVTTFNVPTDIKDNTMPRVYALDQNFPNPFNPVTRINYQIPKNSYVTLIVYDVLGKQIASLVNEEQSAGTYQITFDGSWLSSGIYFYKIQAGDFVATKKLVLMK
ncbi:MAG: fibronectin type III domain-containing protein [Ignavibacteriaceae bacterium]|jgi:predicted MPP superfamily phosphohydrolase